MKILLLFLATLLLFTFTKSQERSIFFSFQDSSQSDVNRADGRNQFFDLPSGLYVDIPFIVNSNTTFPLFNKLSTLFPNISLNDTANLKVVATKTYWRHSGFLPYGLAVEELDLANADAMHTPDMNVTQLSVMYLVYNAPIQGKAYQIRHQVNEICVQVDKETKDYRHFIVDRAYNGIFPNIWNTKIRLIYTGKANTCDFNDSTWADNRAGNWTDGNQTKPQINLHAQGKVVKNYKFREFVEDVLSYCIKFPIYNTLYNCQHFGTNLFNKMTGQNSSLVSADILVRTNPDGTSNLANLTYAYLNKEELRKQIAAQRVAGEDEDDEEGDDADADDDDDDDEEENGKDGKQKEKDEKKAAKKKAKEERKAAKIKAQEEKKAAKQKEREAREAAKKKAKEEKEAAKQKAKEDKQKAKEEKAKKTKEATITEKKDKNN